MSACIELDLMIADKVMGWKCLDRQVDLPYGCVSSFRATAWETSIGVIAEDHIPRFSLDISAAWMVVERLQDLGRSVAIAYDRSHTHTPVLVQVKPAKQNFTEVSITSSSVPLGICLAALKAVE